MRYFRNKLFQRLKHSEHFCRFIYGMCAFFCFGSLAVAIYYFQDVLWLEPCPYCKLQRVIFFIMGCMFTILTIFNPKRVFAKISASLIFIIMSMGIFVAGKHVYMQINPNFENSASCQATSSSILEVLDFEVVRKILSAKGDCGVIDWTFFGLSLPMLSLIAYIGLGIVGIIICFWNIPKPKKL